MRHLALLLLVGCPQSIDAAADCEPIGEGRLSFVETEGDCGAFPDLDGRLDAPRIDSDPRGFRCAYRPERTAACGLAFEVDCENVPPVGALMIGGTLDQVGPDRWEGVGMIRRANDGGVGCRSTYEVEAVRR